MQNTCPHRVDGCGPCTRPHNAKPCRDCPDDEQPAIRGAKRVGTIDMTPTWQGLLPLLLEAYEHGNQKGRQAALEELRRMAKFCDEINAADQAKV